MGPDLVATTIELTPAARGRLPPGSADRPVHHGYGTVATRSHLIRAMYRLDLGGWARSLPTLRS